MATFELGWSFDMLLLLTDEKPEISYNVFVFLLHIMSAALKYSTNFLFFVCFFWMGRHEGLERVDHRMWVKGHLDQPAQLGHIENTKIYSRNVKITSTLFRIRSGFHLYMSAIAFLFFFFTSWWPSSNPYIFGQLPPSVSVWKCFWRPIFVPLCCCGWELSSGQERIWTFCFLSLYISFH